MLALLIFFLIFSSPSVLADCSLPAGIAGQIQWISGDSELKFCDGSNWISTKKGASLGACAETGQINYSAGDLRFCDGSDLFSMKGSVKDACATAGLIQWDLADSEFEFCDGSNFYSMDNSELPCPSGFAKIPNSINKDASGLVNLAYANGWCVSKHEMTPFNPGDWNNSIFYHSYGTTVNAANLPVTSKSDGSALAITSLTQQQAQNSCSSQLVNQSGVGIASGQLMTVYFWKQISESIIGDSINWSEGVVGTGNLSRGNATANPTNLPPDGTMANSANLSTGVFHYTAAGGRTWRMGASGDVIYDWAGNVGEWFKETHNSGSGSDVSIDAATPAYQVDYGGGNTVSLLPDSKATYGTTANGVGRININDVNIVLGGIRTGKYSGNTSEAADGANPGIFYSVWRTSNKDVTVSNFVGYRCIFPL